MKQEKVRAFFVRIRYLILLLGLVLLGHAALLFWTLDVTSYAETIKYVVVLCGAIVLTEGGLWLFGRKSLVCSAPVKGAVKLLYAVVGLSAIGIGLMQSARGSAAETIGPETDFFSGKEVLILVPHQDDDINLAGGLIEEYIRGGSTVTVAFATNGDNHVTAGRRLREATDALMQTGVTGENVIFLGFGDQWEPQTKDEQQAAHIYNSTDGSQVWSSWSGHTQTYGSPECDCYIRSEYTRDNYLHAIRALLLEKRPDVIYCVDTDTHMDHRAVGLFFDEAVCGLLREDPSFRPQIFKGFCYTTAWEAECDFFDSVNLLSTKKPEETIWERTGTHYNWESRVRIPIGSDNLSRYLSENTVAKCMSRYSSQYAYQHSEMVLNGDKVFWERETGSLLYNAVITAGQEPAAVLNDFKLVDSGDVTEKKLSGGSLQADRIEVQLHSPERINEIRLYETPDPGSAITDGYILFEDGSRVGFVRADADGSAIKAVFPERETEQFTIVITGTEGTNAGLTEIEAYCRSDAELRRPEYLMAVDEAGNFVYDYWLEDREYVDLSLYTYPMDPELTMDDVDVIFEGDGNNSYCVEDGILRVHCPEGAAARIRICYGDSISTAFMVSNPGSWQIAGMHLLRWVDHHCSGMMDAWRSFLFEILWYRMHIGI